MNAAHDREIVSVRRWRPGARSSNDNFSPTRDIDRYASERRFLRGGRQWRDSVHSLAA
jgi:hypothetical protein